MKRKSSTKRKGGTKKARAEVPDDNLEADEYVVDKILARAKVAAGGRMKYLVKWQGYTIEKGGCTWEPADNITDKGMLDTFKISAEAKVRAIAQVK